jgi:hypothetical protein
MGVTVLNWPQEAKNKLEFGLCVTSRSFRTYNFIDPISRWVDDESTMTTISIIGSSTVPKKVRFSLDSNQAFTSISTKKEDIRKTWYTKRELSEIRDSVIFIICNMTKRVRVEENNDETVRGLEDRTRQGTLRSRHMRYEAMHAVLDEQRRQRLKGEQNVGLLADAYRSISFKCQRKAYAMGRKDESQIKRRLENVRRSFDKKTKSSDSKVRAPLDMNVMFHCDDVSAPPASMEVVLRYYVTNIFALWIRSKHDFCN